jgi:hypothetical protein
MTLQPEQVVMRLGWPGKDTGVPAPWIQVYCAACGYVVIAHSLDSAIDARLKHMDRCSTIWESDAEMERRTR